MSASTERYLAFDLGAESGRAVVGTLDADRLRLDDAHRFVSRSVRTAGTLYWDVLGIYHEIKQGLTAAASAHPGPFAGIGIDTWGVDFGLLGAGDVLLGNPRHYRDHANDGMLEAAFEIVPRERIFDRTGIQFMQLNSLFQLLSMKRAGSPILEHAQTLLFMPDLLNFWLTGVKAAEYTIASTSQMVDPRTRTWAYDLVEQLGLPAHILPEIISTSAHVGDLRADISAETGFGCAPIIAPGEHDTASAVVAVPASGKDYAYLSSGTWSLMGVELDAPLITADTRAYNFTNEGGACGTTRLLKNIMGLWLVQECRREASRSGSEYSYSQLTALADAAPPFQALIEPDAPEFLAPDGMVTAIRDFCVRTGQPPPDGIGATIRCCLESLALKYRWAIERLEAFRGGGISTIHIVGGGTQNRLLCRLAADAANRRVIAGPVEATAIGNILMQALGTGRVGSLAEARNIVRGSFELDVYDPGGERDTWDAAFGRFLALRERIGKSD